MHTSSCPGKDFCEHTIKQHFTDMHRWECISSHLTSRYHAVKHLSEYELIILQQGRKHSILIHAGGMHPCASEEGKCCGGYKYGASIIRFTSHFHVRAARVMLAYDVYPYCGDGLDLVVTQNFVDSYREKAMLMQHGYAPLHNQPFSNWCYWLWTHVAAFDQVYDCNGDQALHNAKTLPAQPRSCKGSGIVTIAACTAKESTRISLNICAQKTESCSDQAEQQLK